MTLIIAEAGVNHNGDINLAKKLVEKAAEAGADFIKFQTFHSDSLVTASAELAEYQKAAQPEIDTQQMMLRSLELNKKDRPAIGRSIFCNVEMMLYLIAEDFFQRQLLNWSEFFKG